MGGDESIRVGELARQVGLSVRSIKYYEEHGLLQPARSPSRYRLYCRTDIERLERIRQLRGFGLSVSAIKEVLQFPVQRDEDGTRHLSVAALEQVCQSLSEQREVLLARIDRGREELAQVEQVARELEGDLGYLRGHLDARRSRARGDDVAGADVDDVVGARS